MIFGRCKELNNNSKQPMNGLWYNESKFRIELIFNNEMLAFITVELLKEYDKMSNKSRKQQIVDNTEPLRTMLLDFFYPGWQMEYYIRTGKMICS